MKKYDIVYSIGRDCACATYMKKAGLRLCSGPFDWLTHAGFAERFDLLLNDFSGFLEKTDLVQMPKPTQFPADKNNDYYENVRTKLYFWHDFPADVDFDKAYPKVKEKYDRRIKRFYDNIRNSGRVLLIWFSQIDNTPDETVKELCSRFCEKMNKSVDFLIIEHTENLNEIREVRLTDNILRVNCHAQKYEADGTPMTLGNEKLLLPVFMKYKLHVPFYKIVGRIGIKALVKAVCLFIPVKAWRRKLRKLYKQPD